jgi:hypothetical protein
MVTDQKSKGDEIWKSKFWATQIERDISRTTTETLSNPRDMAIRKVPGAAAVEIFSGVDTRQTGN